MFNKIKENSYYIKFKEMRKDPKLRPLTSLIFWFIFMFIIVFFLKGTSSVKTVEINEEKENYEFTYKNDNVTIFGQSYDGKMKFYLDGNRYYYDLKNVYLIVNGKAVIVDNFDLGILKITPSFINNITSGISYIQNGQYKEYVISLNRFINLYENDIEVDSSLASQYNIIIYVYDNMYQLDLSNYYNFRGLNNDGVLTIDIYDSGNFNFTSYYDKLVGGLV